MTLCNDRTVQDSSKTSGTKAAIRRTAKEMGAYSAELFPCSREGGKTHAGVTASPPSLRMHPLGQSGRTLSMQSGLGGNAGDHGSTLY